MRNISKERFSATNELIEFEDGPVSYRFRHAATFAEILATSDLPNGVVNLLTGKRDDLVPHIAGHMDVNAIVDGVGEAELGARLQSGTALNLKRYSNHALPPEAWATERAEDPYWILDTVEFKTAWHPIGL